MLAYDTVSEYIITTMLLSSSIVMGNLLCSSRISLNISNYRIKNKNAHKYGFIVGSHTSTPVLVSRIYTAHIHCDWR